MFSYVLSAFAGSLRGVELTESWRQAMPQSILDRYAIAETRNAAAMFQASHPDLLTEVCAVLDAFWFDVERIVRPGLNKHFISAELDEAFRVMGWREAKFEQELKTDLVLNPYRPAGERVKTHRISTSTYQGHQIDNVKGRVGLDVEWNPKDGNLDRDFSNFRALYEAGVLDLGILVVRREVGMRELWQTVIERAKHLNDQTPVSVEWSKRLKKTPDSPLSTSTTSNYEKLIPRLERGDGGGCPILAIAITHLCYEMPHDLDAEIARVAADHTSGLEVERLSQRMFPEADVGDLDEVVSADDDDDSDD